MATRQIKDAKDLSTNELIYFKGHAKATYMSDGRTVEEAITAYSGGSSSGTDDSSVIYFNLFQLENIEFIDKYNNIEGSGTISQDDYDVYYSALEKNRLGLLIDIYCLHTLYVEDGSSWFAVYSIFYDEGYNVLKYVRVVFYSNLNVFVETRTSNSDSTITSIKVDNVTKLPSNGVVDLGYISKKLTTSTSSSMTLSPNVYYRNTNASLSSLTITLGSVSNSNIINEYFVEFTTRSAGTTVSFPSTIKWANGTTPTFEAGCTYQVSIVNNLGTYIKFA